MTRRKRRNADALRPGQIFTTAAAIRRTPPQQHNYAPMAGSAEQIQHYEDVVVIFAGYPDKMERFLQKNPGLRSRIAFHVPFADYGTRDLCDIAKLIAKKKGLTLSEDACEKLYHVFDAARYPHRCKARQLV